MTVLVLFNLSTTVSMMDFPQTFGRASTKSSPMSDLTNDSTGSGKRSPAG